MTGSADRWLKGPEVVSNLESEPQEAVRLAGAIDDRASVLLPEREVPLGGVRGITVRRTLPHRTLPTVSAWCFLDHFGPSGAPMVVLPHPHTGLQTVTWPFTGSIRHRDSLGNDLIVRPGELNLMTSGGGVSHSEVSMLDADTPLLHGLQLWVALPDRTRDGPARFEHYDNLPTVEAGGLTATVLVGEFMGGRSPAMVDTPLVGLDVSLGAGSSVLALNPAYEHAILAIDGPVDVSGEPLPSGPLLFLGVGRDELLLTTQRPTRLTLIGGAPFDEALVMWWNFVARSHEEIVRAREEWQTGSERFGQVSGHDGERIPAPVLPGVNLKPRYRPR